jgi:uncharacterized protein (TIGR00730 family)
MQCHSICVFCGSSTGNEPTYAEAARSLGAALASQKIRLVYGGGSVGLMGILADAVLEHGGSVVGVIPQALWDREVGHRALTELHIVANMHERKAMMADLSDGFVALPGGIGTMEELFEAWTWAQLGVHEKPCALLNVSGYFDALLTFIDHMVAQGLLRHEHREMLIVADNPGALLSRIESYNPPIVAKWLDANRT